MTSHRNQILFHVLIIRNKSSIFMKIITCPMRISLAVPSFCFALPLNIFTIVYCPANRAKRFRTRPLFYHNVTGRASLPCKRPLSHAQGMILQKQNRHVISFRMSLPLFNTLLCENLFRTGFRVLVL